MVKLLNLLDPVLQPQVEHRSIEQQFLEVDPLNLKLDAPIGVLCIIQGRLVDRVALREVFLAVPV